MAITTVHGSQLRAGSIPRAKLDPTLDALLTTYGTNISDIYATMSTDAERLAAITAVNDAWANADGSLQTLVTNMVNATKVGAGLESDGSLLVAGTENYIAAATSLKQAITLIDTAVKAADDARIAGDAALQTQVTNLVAAGAAGVQANLDTEVAARIAADTTLQTNIGNEATARTTADTTLQTNIDNEATARAALNTTLSTSIANEATARTAADSAEATTRAAADTTLQSNIDAEALARTNADNTLNTAISDEAAARATAVTGEATARAAADTALDTRITAIEANNVTSMSFVRYVTKEGPTGTMDGTNRVFQLAHSQVTNTEHIYYNGQLLDEGASNDYVVNATGEITLNASLPAPNSGDGDKLRVTYFYTA